MDDGHEKVLGQIKARGSEPLLCLILTGGPSGLDGVVTSCLKEHLVELDSMSGSDCLIVTLRNNHGLILRSRRPTQGIRSVTSLEAIRGFPTLDADVFAICSQLGISFDSIPTVVFAERNSEQVVHFPIADLLAKPPEDAEDSDVFEMFRWVLSAVGRAATRREGTRLKDLQKSIENHTGGRFSIIYNGVFAEIIRGLANAAFDQTR